MDEIRIKNILFIISLYKSILNENEKKKVGIDSVIFKTELLLEVYNISGLICDIYDKKIKHIEEKMVNEVNNKNKELCKEHFNQIKEIVETIYIENYKYLTKGMYAAYN